MFLLDTQVVLELRKAKAGRTDAGLARWAAATARQNLFVSALSLLELEDGAGRPDKARPSALRAWIDDRLLPAFDGRILAIDRNVVRRRALIPIADARDALLAATAAEHGLTLVTRRTSAYKGARIKTFDPWGYSGEEVTDDGDWREAGRTGSLWLKNLFVRA